MCVCMYTCMFVGVGICYGVGVEDRGRLAGVGLLLLPYMSLKSNPGVWLAMTSKILCYVILLFIFFNKKIFFDILETTITKNE